MRSITEEEWAKHLEQGETKFERKREIGMVLQTLVHVGSEKMTEISNILQVSVAGSGRIKEILEELEQLRVFSNDALRQRGKQMGIVVPQISPDEWRWSMTRREAKKKAVDDRSTSGSDDEVEVLPNPTATAATTNA
jgi:ferredoxin-fold anticodon binding domain-containing protein